MRQKLSPFRFDLGRYSRLLTHPNIGYPTPNGPHDEVFPDSGLLRLPGVISPEICDRAIAEYAEFEDRRRVTNCAVTDEQNRNYRVINFHLRSEAMKAIGLNKAFHQFACRFFGAQSTLYTSLYFKHGSQQDPHINTPFFWTRPFNLFVGVWVALEDVQPTAGPLVYYHGSHRHFNSEAALRDVFARAGGDVQRMFKLMQQEIEIDCKPELSLIRKGDAVIWHPGLMHGGSKASVQSATRHSAVFHFAPLGVNVRDNRVFPNDFWNFPTYGVVKESESYYCRASLPAAMI
ncbi:MAG: phytanoyl-CoA dioxygenase family protein [Steroidobacteraceae bacterium]